MGQTRIGSLGEPHRSSAGVILVISEETIV